MKRILIFAVALLVYATALPVTPPTYPLKLSVVSGLKDSGTKSGFPCLSEIWVGTFGTAANLQASGGIPPYQWKFPDLTSQPGSSVTWKITKSGCLGLRDSSGMWQKIYVLGKPPGPPSTTSGVSK